MALSEKHPLKPYLLGAGLVALAVLVAVFVATRTETGSRLIAWLEPLSAVGGPFELVNQHGEVVRDTDLIGRPTAIMFGYTTCPDVCPTTLNEMATWRAALGAEAADVQFVFVTVDPERDSADVLAQYVSYFDEEIIALTGTEAQIAGIVSAYRVYVRRVPDDDFGYPLDHTSSVYLMDADGHYRGGIEFGEAEASALAKLRDLVEAS